MRLFGAVTGAITRYDRAEWMTPPFDSAILTPPASWRIWYVDAETRVGYVEAESRVYTAPTKGK